MSAYDVDVTAVPDTAPFQCVCGRGLPADGEFVRLEARTTFGDVWLCGQCQEHVLAANRLMSLKLYEQRVAELKATVDGETETLHAERERLVDIEAREVAAVQRAAAAEERAELAEASAVQLQQTVADLERLLREQTDRANQAERGSVSVQLVQAHHERMEAIVAENAGACAVSESKSKRARPSKTASTKQEVAA